MCPRIGGVGSVDSCHLDVDGGLPVVRLVLLRVLDAPGHLAFHIDHEKFQGRGLGTEAVAVLAAHLMTAIPRESAAKDFGAPCS